MNWRNPNKEVPKNKEMVWVMLEPHKDRGTLLESSASIEIVCGEVSYGNDGSIIVENYDELGMGSISWRIKGNFYSWDSTVLAWIPLTEMALPTWNSNDQIEYG